MTRTDRRSAASPLRVAAAGLAAHCRMLAKPGEAIAAWRRIDAVPRWLAEAREAAVHASPEFGKAAEWLLDNDYQVHRAFRQVRHDLPASFYARLPAMDCEGEHFPRAFAAAHGLLNATRLQLSLDAAVDFVRGYQEQTSFSIAELWAFPTMLRLACLEILAVSFGRLFPAVEAPFEPTRLAERADSFDDTERVARAIANLGLIAAIPWEEFFDRTSLVEEVLATDPSGVYPMMDFATRDQYRRAVEEIAEQAAAAETDVASRAVAEAAAMDGDQLRGHVGYWLGGEGRASLEEAVGARLPRARVRARWMRRNARGLYAGALLLIGLGALILPAVYMALLGPATYAWIVYLCVAPIPASILAVTVVHWAATQLVRPKVLPKLDFDEAIHGDCSALVVMPVLVGSAGEAEALLERLEGHRLANPDPVIRFLLLTDVPDAAAGHLPEDEPIERALAEGIEALNRRYGGCFHLLHRARLFNPNEGCWMGWERKRGKLEQLNRLLLTGDQSSFALRVGDTESLVGTRFVVTLDADTRLPANAVNRLVGTLAHPLNKARFDPDTGRLKSGYSIIQPRVEVSPESGNRSIFARLYTGDTAIDIYSRAVSDVYQDLFGEGIFVGKGIYEVASFHRSVDGRVPENAILSHDLFEGILGRAALATDIVLYESFPGSYLEFVRRWHRWVRGDWQLLPWLGRYAPGADRLRLRNRLSGLDRWKIADNLRRSLIAPGLIAFAIAGWLVLPGSPWVWTALTVLAPAAHLFTDLISGLARGPRRGSIRGLLGQLRDQLGRWFMAIAFLPKEAAVALHAVGTVLWRIRVTRRRMLQWTSAAHTATHYSALRSRQTMWSRLWSGPAFALATAFALALLRPSALPAAFPLLLLWGLSPEIALWLGRPRRQAARPLSDDDRLFLRRLARRTWLYFETFAGPEDNWLPPDNYQEQPFEETAHRTSPTNIGMMVLACSAARDLGHIGTSELAARLANLFVSLGTLERHRGHFLNWYDTRTLAPLEPRYVSTVDSGNLAACLIAVAGTCRDAASAPLFAADRWRGLLDVIGIVEEQAAGMSDPRAAELQAAAKAMEDEVVTAIALPASWMQVLDALGSEALALEEAAIRAISGSEAPPSVGLSELSVWIQRLAAQVSGMRRDLELAAPWMVQLETAPPRLDGLRDLLAPDQPLEILEHRVPAIREMLRSQQAEAAEWTATLDQLLEAGLANQRELVALLHSQAEQASGLAYEMDFAPLYDRERRLFHIGYNVSSDRLDPHHYDLLATEARIASYFAIAKGDVPVEHWFFLGRPLTRESGSIALLSWNGSMFEYLMAPIFLRSGPESLVGVSERAAVEMQRDYARSLSVPWGISESAFALRDPDHRYRYQAFGSPGLGLRRDLGLDLVIAPYASALALATDPGEAVDNLRALWRMGANGSYGFVEALDFTTERLAHGRRFTAVRAYMAHHQGMIISAVANALSDDLFVRRFRSDPRVQTVDLLLSERVPREVPSEIERIHERQTPPQPGATRPAPQSWAPTQRLPFPAMAALGNGRLSSWISEAGGGALHWRERALTRFAGDATRDAEGLWIYVHDDETGALWSATRQPDAMPPQEYQVTFHPHMAEFHRRNEGIALRTEVCVAHGDDIEIRRVTIVNESARPRRLTLTSFAEVVLAAPAEDERHPAFSKLFVRSEFLAGLGALLFSRRPRHPKDSPPTLIHRLIGDGAGPIDLAFETDRRRFLGRLGDPRHPQGLSSGLSQKTGWTLDPAMALQTAVELAPHGSSSLCFVTIAGGSPEAALEIAERYATPAAIEWAFEDARTGVTREVQDLDLKPEQLGQIQTLGALLVYPHPALRASDEIRRPNAFGQPQLWGMALSGDHPILLVRLDEGGTSQLVHDLIAAHKIWRKRGIHCDLVMLKTSSSSYSEPQRDRLMSILEEEGLREFLGRKAGIHFLSADQLGAEMVRLLESVARVLLSESRGDLGRQLAAVGTPQREIPLLSPTLEPAAGAEQPPLERPRDLRFDNGFGGFAENDDYLIHLEPGDRTPAPWSNIMANPHFGTLVTESGGGFTWSINSGENRITPWTNDPVCDTPGEMLYLRDEESGEIWTPVPFAAGAAACQVRHAPGETVWIQRSRALDQELTAFVAQDDPVKIVRLRLRNPGARARRVTATYYAQWVLGALPSVSIPSVIAEYDAKARTILARNPWNPEFGERVAFLTADREPHSLTLDRQEFLGREGDQRRPAALLRWGMTGNTSSRVDPCGAYQVHVDLAPGEEQEVLFVLGQGADRAEAVKLARRWRDKNTAERGLDAVKAHWHALLGTVQVKTPDPAFDLLVNRCLLHQTTVSRILARAGFYQAGGAVGFRDQLQDMLALLIADPPRMRDHIIACASHQFEEGDVMHWWHPPSGRGVRTRCSDDLLWLPFATASYVQATGDIGLLSERAAFLRAPPLAEEEEDRYALFESSPTDGSIFDHCVRAIEHGVTEGAHGLPLIGTGDWNDGMDRIGREGRGESVWLAWFSIVTLQMFGGMARRLGHDDLAADWSRRADRLREAAEAAAWDGEWYRRAFDDHGEPYGSATNDECRIDSISQSWAVLAGADAERVRTALAAVERELVLPDEQIVRLLTPPFDRTLRDPGYIKSYPPGVRENGGQYTHAAAWLGFAYAHLGDGGSAYRIFDMLNPLRHSANREDAERYRTEPYAVAADIFDGDGRTGQGGWTWYTGSASWLWRLGVEAILGIRPCEGGITLAPCLPRDWPECEVRISRPGGSLHVTIVNGGGGNGKPEVSVDGHPWAGGPIVFPEDGSVVQVVARVSEAPPDLRQAAG